MSLLDYDLLSVWDELYNVGAEGKTGHPNTRPEVKLGYLRQTQWSGGVRYANYYLELPGLTNTSLVVIVGGGFSFSAEYMKDTLGFTNVIGLDTSSYIHANKGLADDAEVIPRIQAVGLDPLTGRGQELMLQYTSNGPNGQAPPSIARTNATVLDETGNNNGSRRAIRAAISGNPNNPADWAIAEGMIESLSDDDVQQASAIAHQYATNIAWTFIPRDAEKWQVGQDTNTAGAPWNGRGHHHELNFRTRAEWTALLPNDYLISGMIKATAPRITLNGVGV